MSTEQTVETIMNVEKKAINFDPREFPFHETIYNTALRMQFVLQNVKKNGEHEMTAQGKTLTLRFNPENKVVVLERKLPSGNITNDMVVDGEKTPVDALIKSLAACVFLYGDEQAKVRIEKDKEAWNRKYAKTQGEWK